MTAKLPGCVVPVEIAGLTEGFQLRPDRFFSRVTVDLWRQLKVALQPLPPPEARLVLNEDMTGCLGICTCDIVIDTSILRNHSMLVSRESPSLGLISLVDSKLIYDFGRGMVFQPPEIDTNRDQMMEPRRLEETRREDDSQRLDSRPIFTVTERQSHSRNGSEDFHSLNEIQHDPVDPRILRNPELGRLHLGAPSPEFQNNLRSELLGERIEFARDIRLENRRSRFDRPKPEQPRFSLPNRSNPIHGNLQNNGIGRNSFNHRPTKIRGDQRQESVQPTTLSMQSPRNTNFPNRQQLGKKPRFRRRKPAQINKVVDDHQPNSGMLRKAYDIRRETSGQVMKVFDDRLKIPGEIMNVYDDRPLSIEEQKKLNEKSRVPRLLEKNIFPDQGKQRNNLKRPGEILQTDVKPTRRSKSWNSNNYCEICDKTGHTTLRCWNKSVNKP